MSKRKYDFNGWLEVRENPITRVGVFPYLGSEINAPISDKIYQVYRPAEELSKQETLDSFKLIPFIDEHEMLGLEATPAERKGIQGTVGEQVVFDGEYIRANIKVHSTSAIKLIDNGKIELSPGYRSTYDFDSPGEFNGKRYDAVQRNIRANHLALVHEGRTGPDVAVQDHSIFTIDTKELLKMTVEQLLEAIAQLSDQDKAQVIAALTPDTADNSKDDENDTKDAPGDEGDLGSDEKAQAAAAASEAETAAEKAVEAAEEAAEAASSGDEDALGEAAESLGEAEEAIEAAIELVGEATMDGLSKRLKKVQKRVDVADSGAAVKREIARLRKQVSQLKQQPTQVMDTGALIKALAGRDELASKLHQFVGVFDHSTMTRDQVAQYGTKKLGITCAKGTETIAIDAWLQGRVPDSQKPTATKDAALASGDILNKW